MSTVASSTAQNLCYICGSPAFCEQDKDGSIKAIVFDVVSGVEINLCSSKCFRVYRIFTQLNPNDDLLNDPLLKILERYSKKHWDLQKKSTKKIFNPIEKRKNIIKDKINKAPSPAESKEEKKRFK